MAKLVTPRDLKIPRGNPVPVRLPASGHSIGHSPRIPHRRLEIHLTLLSLIVTLGNELGTIAPS